MAFSASLWANSWYNRTKWMDVCTAYPPLTNRTRMRCPMSATPDSTRILPNRKHCKFCGGEFRVKPSHYNRSTYCSRQCMAADYKTRLQGVNNPHYSAASKRICTVCGKEYQSYNKTRKYCSWHCAGLSDANIEKLRIICHIPKQHRQRIGRNCKCKACGQQFFSIQRRNYCIRCATYGTKSNRVCVICGQQFKSSAPQKTCSVKCHSVLKSELQRGEKSHRWQGGKTLATSIFRGSLEYKNWRSAVFQRDDYTCQLCHDRGGKLSAHHIRLFSQHPELALEVANGITLCWQCHASIRGKESQYEVQFFAITGLDNEHS